MEFARIFSTSFEIWSSRVPDVDPQQLNDAMTRLTAKQKTNTFTFGDDLVSYYDEPDFKALQPFVAMAQLTVVQNATLERVFAMSTNLLSDSQKNMSGERLTASIRLRFNMEHLKESHQIGKKIFQPTEIVPDPLVILKPYWNGKVTPS